jgi:hypothetical protein
LTGSRSGRKLTIMRITRTGSTIGGSLACLAVAMLTLATSAVPAGAATQVGQTVAPFQCSGAVSSTNLQTSSLANSYGVPAPGVITSWSIQSGPSPVVWARLKLARPAGGSNYTIVAESAQEAPARDQVSTFATRIPVAGGELLGATTQNPGTGDCFIANSGPEFTVVQSGVEQPVNSTASYGTLPSTQLDIAATLEADADGDGFGDETQDACPADAALQQAPCDRTAPDTTITGGPKSKEKKGKATFEFSSSEPGSTFECRLDENSGFGFAPCSSPANVKVGKGEHTFQVRAVDGTGNVDASPATQTWKVKKKKKKKN